MSFFFFASTSVSIQACIGPVSASRGLDLID